MRSEPYREAPIPKDEKERLESLYKLNILDTPAEERFDRITKLALVLFKVPISTITLVDSSREWFKSCQGLPAREGKRSISFCGHAMLADDYFVIPDTKADGRFAKNPMVLGKPFIRFYAAIPLRSADGKNIGAFCIKDYKPGKFDFEKITWLKALASWAEIEINAHELSRALKARQQAEEKLAEANDTLRVFSKILRHDLLNHLTVIKWNIENLVSEKISSNRLDDLMTATNKSVNLLKQVGQMESDVTGGTPLRDFEIHRLIENTKDLFPAIEFKIEGGGKVLADEALGSAIENIIRNAQMHGKTKTISVKITNKNNFVEIAIADFGKGIPKKIKDKLFTEGFKYGTTGNLGLGLYITKKTITRYGGNINVKDNRPKGAVFTIKLPSA